MAGPCLDVAPPTCGSCGRRSPPRPPSWPWRRPLTLATSALSHRRSDADDDATPAPALGAAAPAASLASRGRHGRRAHRAQLPRGCRPRAGAGAAVRRHANRLRAADGLASQPRVPLRQRQRRPGRPGRQEAAPGQGGAHHLRRRLPVRLRARLARPEDVPHPRRDQRGGELAGREGDGGLRREGALRAGNCCPGRSCAS